MALTCLPLSLLPEPTPKPPPFRFAGKWRQKNASATHNQKSQASPRECRHAKRNLRLARTRVFRCPQTYGLRNTSVPSIATKPGRPNGLPIFATATTSRKPFRPRSSPLGLEGSVGKGHSERIFARRRCAGSFWEQRGFREGFALVNPCPCEFEVPFGRSRRSLSENDVVFGKGLLPLIRALASLRFRLAGQGGLFPETTWFSEKVCFR